MSRFKNYGLWVSLFSLIGILLKDKLPVGYDVIVTATLSILVTLGVISNPSSGNGYVDK